jgi:8-oxo-dGTP pyrophosphatase MutT (NUDIX family)
MQTYDQVSAGGVAYRMLDGRIEVALISVGQNERWQLPKGTIDKGELNEAAALREVREEAGIDAELIVLLDTVEYWYYATQHGKRVRYHKHVHFFLMRYLAGDVNDHDHEVNEARWVEIGEAITVLAFKSEQEVVQKAQAYLKQK